MGIKIRPTSEIITRLNLQPNGDVQKFFTSTCAKHMDKYVPMDKGNLSDYRTTDDSVIYEQKYAKYQYRGMRQDGTHVIKNYSKDKHPLANSYWDRRMVTAEMDDVVKEVQDYIGGIK